MDCGRKGGKHRRCSEEGNTLSLFVVGRIVRFAAEGVATVLGLNSFTQIYGWLLRIEMRRLLA
jgi:hypothetical protein